VGGEWQTLDQSEMTESVWLSVRDGEGVAGMRGRRKCVGLRLCEKKKGVHVGSKTYVAVLFSTKF